MSPEAVNDFWNGLTQAQKDELAKSLTPRTSEYWAHQPTATQAAFLLLDCKEALFGGSAGGGKSDALCQAALQYVDIPNYSAIIFRRSYADLARPGAIMDRMREWLDREWPSGKKPAWNEQKKAWRFPSGAVLAFGYLDNYSDVYAYQGAEFQCVLFDELTQFEEREYLYLMSRLRRLQTSDVPLRMRGATNPGGVGHSWVNRRFRIEGPANGRVFVPSSLKDNPHLDQKSYSESLMALDDVTRAQLLDGDWSVRDTDNALVPEWTKEIALACTKEVQRPLFYTPYDVGDLGSRDLTVWLLAWWDFENSRIVIEDEVVLKNPSTPEMIAAVKKAELARFGLDPTPSRTDIRRDRVRRFSDVDWRLVNDFKLEGLHLVPTKKPDAEGYRNKARGMIARGQVIVHPRCRTLLLTFESAVWNAKRTDYARTAATGHADAWDAFVYLVRNIDQNHNPMPVNASNWTDQFGRFRQPAANTSLSPAARALRTALGGKTKQSEALDIWLPGHRRRKK